MPGETNQDSPQPPHVELVDDNPTQRHEGEQSPGLTNGKGWDGKLRVPGRASLANPEALSDPEYSDEDNVVQGQEIEADEGRYPSPLFPDQASRWWCLERNICARRVD